MKHLILVYVITLFIVGYFGARKINKLTQDINNSKMN